MLLAFTMVQVTMERDGFYRNNIIISYPSKKRGEYKYVYKYKYCAHENVVSCYGEEFHVFSRSSWYSLQVNVKSRLKK